jgi:hypothetical protein
MPSVPTRGISFDDGRVEMGRGDLPRHMRSAGLSGEYPGPTGLASPAHEAPDVHEEPSWIEHAIHGVRRFIGKGPKGYRRSDQLILEDLCETLGEHHPDAREIEVVVERGVVHLGGHVRTRGEKWLAEDIAEEVRGVQSVENGIRIAR